MKFVLHKELTQVQKASRQLPFLSEKKVNAVLRDLASIVVSEEQFILSQNAKDVKTMNPEDPRYDRLLITSPRLKSIAQDIKKVAGLPSPIHKILATQTRPNGLTITKVTVPLGVIGVIYEARPNVTLDVFSLCFKSGNACVLKGGSEAVYSNAALVKIIRQVLKKHEIDTHAICLLPGDRELLKKILHAREYIDVLIPRGGKNLIQFVRDNATVPVIETGAGIVHIFFDESGDLNKGKSIVFNAKTRRVSVCNALDTLIIHQKRLKDLSELVSPLQECNVEIFADAQAYQALKGSYEKKLLQKASPADFGREFLSHKMAIKTVANLDEALEHIDLYSSKHSEAIISKNAKNIETFLNKVDAACVYANASTAFSDGGQFGMGAEIGISTQKLHARGPMALPELTSYKWMVRGNGQIRPA